MFCQIFFWWIPVYSPCGFEVYYQELIVWFLFYQESIVCVFFRLLRHQLISEPWLTLVWWLTGETITTTTMMAVTISTTQSSLRLSSLIFVMKINNFMIQPSRLWTRFKKRLPPCLTEILIAMTKSSVITELMALSIVVQTRTGNKTTMKKTVKMRSMQRESLEIIMVLRGIMAEITRSRGTIEWK